jgi:hypothetical protein
MTNANLRTWEEQISKTRRHAGGAGQESGGKLKFSPAFFILHFAFCISSVTSLFK